MCNNAASLRIILSLAWVVAAVPAWSQQVSPPAKEELLSLPPATHKEAPRPPRSAEKEPLLSLPAAPPPAQPSPAPADAVASPPASAPVAASPAEGAPPSAVETPAVDASVSTSPVAPATQEGTPKLSWQGSIMFDIDSIRSLRRMVEAYMKGGVLADKEQKDNLNSQLDELNNMLKQMEDGNGLRPASAEARSITVNLPSYALGSIVYDTPKQWALWVNGYKMIASRKEENAEFVPTKVTRTQAEFCWTPAVSEVVRVLWDAKQKQKELMPAVKKYMANIRVDKAHSKVYVVLQPNQTFLPGLMEVREGTISVVQKQEVTLSPPVQELPVTEDATVVVEPPSAKPPAQSAPSAAQ